MMAPFDAHADGYLARGFSPLPIEIGFKHPSFDGHNMKGWSRYCSRPAQAWRIQKWKGGNLGICLAMGFNNLIGVDVDDPLAYGAVREVLGPLRAPAKIGQRGATAFFYDPTGEIKTKIFRAKGAAPGKIGGALVEILGWGRQSVIPPSIHPKTGRAYRWHNASLDGLTPSDLPVITAAHIGAIGEILKPHRYEPKPFEIDQNEVKKIEIEEAERRRYERYAEVARSNTISNLSGQSHPGRNQALYNATCALAWTVKADIFSRSTIEADLMEACKSNGLITDNGEKDARDTIKRAFSRTANAGIPKLKERAR